MKMRKITISMPIPVIDQLRVLIPRGKRNAFIVETIEEHLRLSKDFADAAKDPEREKLCDEWDALPDD